MKLLESETLLKEERARARKLTHGIVGFGSFSQRSSSKDAIMKDSSFQRFGRSNSHCNDDQNPENESLVSSKSLINQGTRTAQQTHEGINLVSKEPENETHPWVSQGIRLRINVESNSLFA